MSNTKLKTKRRDVMTLFKLQINHGGVLVADIETNDIDEVTDALDGFEYELTEMLSGACDE